MPRSTEKAVTAYLPCNLGVVYCISYHKRNGIGVAFKPIYTELDLAFGVDVVKSQYFFEIVSNTKEYTRLISLVNIDTKTLNKM